MERFSAHTREGVVEPLPGFGPAPKLNLLNAFFTDALSPGNFGDREGQAGIYHSFRCLYGNSTIVERQTANFCADGLSTLTWPVYVPGCNLPSGTLNLTGTAFDLGFSPSVI